MNKKAKSDFMEIIKLAVFLGLIAALASGLLAFVYEKTKEPIAQAQEKETVDALKAVLPDNAKVDLNQKCIVKAADGRKITFYAGKVNSEILAVAGQGLSSQGTGYAEPITVMVGLKPDGTVRTTYTSKKNSSEYLNSAVIVTKQNETPGLGTVVCNRSRNKTVFDIIEGKTFDPDKLPPNPILDQFADKKAEKKDLWMVKKDGGEFDYISGATISSRAVVSGVWNVSSTYLKNREKILKKLE